MKKEQLRAGRAGETVVVRRLAEQYNQVVVSI